MRNAGGGLFSSLGCILWRSIVGVKTVEDDMVSCSDEGGLKVSFLEIGTGKGVWGRRRARFDEDVCWSNGVMVV